MELNDAAVVITGASSGIGRATALEFARRGARLVLAARRWEVLEEVAAECRRFGVSALAVQADVGNQEDVNRLAERAIETYGRIDVWVNNAGVSMLGSFESAPLDAFGRVIQTNLWGTIHGARAALPVFRRQESGVLINVASMVADVSQPYASAYEISKHGIRALGSSLRQELLLEGQEGISVCTVMPATIDTPLFQHAANYTGRAVRAMPPVVPAEQVAQAIVRFAERPGRETFVGASAWMMHLKQVFAPGMTERELAKMVDMGHFESDKPAGPSNGNLFTPMEEGKGISGGWMGQGNGAIGKVAAGAAAVAGLAFLVRRLTTPAAPPPPRNAVESATRALSGVASKVPTRQALGAVGAVATMLPIQQVIGAVGGRLPGRQEPSTLARLGSKLPTRQVVDAFGGLTEKLPTQQVMSAVGSVPSMLPTEQVVVLVSSLPVVGRKRQTDGTLGNLSRMLTDRLPIERLPLVGARRG